MIGSGFDRRDSGADGAGSSSAGAKVRVYELAKDCNLAPKDLVAKIRTLGIEVANHMSNLDVADADRVRRTIERERQESLVETRINDTVIRRRSRLPGGAPAARPQSVAQPAAVSPKPAPPYAPTPEPLVPATRVVFAVPEPEEQAPDAVEPPQVVAPVAPAMAPVVEAPGPAEPVAAEVAPESPNEIPQETAPPPVAAAPVLPPVQEVKPAATQPAVTKIPQPVVTGSAATGQFIQLPGMPGRDGTVPKIEITNRDEELRRLGRSGLVSRGPGGRDWRTPGGAPGQRPGGPPRKRVAAAGK